MFHCRRCVSIQKYCRRLYIEEGEKPWWMEEISHRYRYYTKLFLTNSTVWFVLKNGHLITVKGKKVGQQCFNFLLPQLAFLQIRSLDMRLCTVRMANSINMQLNATSTSKLKESTDRSREKDSEKAECVFEVVSAQKKLVSRTGKTEREKERLMADIADRNNARKG